MRLSNRWIYRARPAVAAVEASLILPVLVTLLLGIWELGRVIQVYQVVSNAAREGSRQAASAKYTKEQVRQSVFDYLVNANVPLHNTIDNSSLTLATMNATITVDNVTTGNEVFEASQLDQVRVTVAVPTRNYRWLLTGMFLDANSSVQATTDFLCTRDNPIVVSEAIPQSPLSN